MAYFPDPVLVTSLPGPEPFVWTQAVLGSAHLATNVWLGDTNEALFVVNRRDGTSRTVRLHGNVRPSRIDIATSIDVVFVQAGSNLLAIELSSLQERWRTEVDLEPSPIAMAVADSLLLATRSPNEVCAYDAANGSIVWRTGPLTDSDIQLLAAGSDVALAFTPTSIIALSVHDGRQLWIQASDVVYGTPAFVDNAAVITDWAGRVALVDLSTGARRWTDDLEWGTACAAITTPGGCWIAGAGGEIAVLDARTGSRRATAHLRETVFAKPLLGAGYVWVVTGHEHLYALAPATAQVIDRRSLPTDEHRADEVRGGMCYDRDEGALWIVSDAVYRLPLR